MGQICVNRRYELPIEDAPAAGANDPLRCAYAFAVSPTIDEPLGYCTAQNPMMSPLEIVADRTGTWEFDFVGEPETLAVGSRQRSTRFFEIDVFTPDGVPVTGGRVHASQWLLNAHRFENTNSSTFYVRRPVGNAAWVWVLSQQDWQGGQYLVLANREGLSEHPDQSWCQYGDPEDGQCGPADLEGLPQRMYAEYPLYLNFPDPAPEAPPEAEILELNFNDAAGTASISPDGDGVQDDGTFGFQTPVPGIYRILIDANLDGAFDPLTEVIVRDAARIGRNQFVWDGKDAAGIALPAGEYPFQVALNVAETHFPLADI